MVGPPLRPLVLVAFVALVGALLVPGVAAAQRSRTPATAEQQDEARDKAREGLRLYEDGQIAPAYAAFQEADRLYHAPSISIYIARCQRRLGKLLDARATYEGIVAERLPLDASIAFVTAHADAVKELADLAPRVPTLRVGVARVPSGSAEISIDGQRVTDEKKELDPGPHTIEVKTAGGATIRRTVTVAEGSHETLTLDPAAAPPAERVNRVPAIVLFAVGGAAAVVGGVTGGLALAQAGDVKARCGGVPPCAPTPPDTTAALQAEAGAATAKAWVSNVAIGVAVAGVATGAVLFALGLPKAAETVQGAAGRGGVTLRF